MGGRTSSTLPIEAKRATPCCLSDTVFLTFSWKTFTSVFVVLHLGSHEHTFGLPKLFFQKCSVLVYCKLCVREFGEQSVNWLRASSPNTSEEGVSRVDLWTVVLYTNSTYERIVSHCLGFFVQ